MELNTALTLGSLFDGSGGFPLGGLLCGITPVWSSEIEPFPIRVTTKRLPFMKHYGDISQMDGGKIEPVDIITFGSPCQDLSIAGKRKGLGGDDISGDYNTYDVTEEQTIDGHTVLCKGNDGLIYTATWTDGTYSYAVMCDAGMNVEQLSVWVEALA